VEFIKKPNDGEYPSDVIQTMGYTSDSQSGISRFIEPNFHIVVYHPD
jgi:hypothetical protein